MLVVDPDVDVDAVLDEEPEAGCFCAVIWLLVATLIFDVRTVACCCCCSLRTHTQL